MAKAIKWQIPFASLSGTLYRIDIYAEGYSGDPIQLTAGESPFVTEEDSSEDFFAPIRTQTGSIQVCTRKPDGTMLTLDEILPANNIDHPVRLINLSNSNAIEWQGFLSCEAYSQNYTAIPENLTLSVISVLEAMDSVQLDQTRSFGMTTIRTALKTAMDEMMLQSGMSLYTNVNYSGTASRILSKYIDNTLFFDSKEYDNENSVTYIISGISVKDVLSRIAAYMGWTVREQGTTIYFERIGGDIYTLQVSYSNFGNAGVSPTQVNITSADIANFDWRGVDHKRDIRQGAKSVEVVAKLEKYEIKFSLPEFPYGQSSQFYRKYSYSEWLYLVAALDASAYSNLSFGYYKGTINIPRDVQTYNGVGTLQEVFASMIAVDPTIADINIATQSVPPIQTDITAGAFLAQAAYEDQQQNAHATTDGLYCVWLPDNRLHSPSYIQDAFADLGYIFKMYNPLSVRMNKGYIKLSANMTHIVYEYDNYEDFGVLSKNNTDWADKLLMHIKVGNQYWNGSTWTSTESKIWIDIEGSNFKKNWDTSMSVVETDGHLIPINTNLQGRVEIAIYSIIDATANGFKLLAETFFSELNVDYLISDDEVLTGRSENHYYHKLDTHFRDEISIGVDLASFLNNQPSPSLIMNNISGTTPMTTLDYVLSGGGIEARRPEVDLLNRLASYYGAARQTLELEVAHPTAASLPLIKLNGINDGKAYLPLSESRDWQTGVCKLTCFETPT